MATIKQIVIFQLKALRMASFLEFVLQVLNIVKSYRDFGEAALRSENPKTFGFSLFFRTFGLAEGTRVRKNPKSFGFSLTYLYLCSQIG